jgi:hypothetical protein
VQLAVQRSSLLLPAACAEETQYEAVPQCRAASVPDSQVEQRGAFQTADQAGSAAGSAAVQLSSSVTAVRQTWFASAVVAGFIVWLVLVFLAAMCV